ncbi:TetR/AcrR family transcriptional regulator [Eisenibacter elegans]|uniref:TetR/AcrR family transcriptional regulator n=1 Tax=Eisenibacter elegans TaxID=997 RepID=UPI000415BE26|nr:TetR/AcrR family transcriptional regulator [Eisenibacter elegans]
MADLAAATGLTKGAFYHHFASKEEVMKKSLQATTLWFERKVFGIAYQEGSPKERLAKMTEVLFEAFTRSQGGCFFANTILETAHVEDTFLEEIEHFFGLFEQALSHIFQTQYSKGLAHQIIADIEGSIIVMQLRKDPQILKDALNRTAARL